MVRARFPLSRRGARNESHRIVAIRRDVLASTRDANARVFVRTSRPSVSPSRHIQHTSSIVAEKTDTHTRSSVSSSSSIESTHARDEVYF